MMVLVVLSVAFIWIVQLFFLEKNFIDSTVFEIQNKLKPLMETIETEDLYGNEDIMLNLSKTAKGKMIVLDENGTLISLYSSGHKLHETSRESVSPLLDYVKQTKEYSQLLKGISYNKVLRYGSDPFALEMGIPIKYGEQHASIILYQPLDQLHTVLMINRNQLIILSVALTLLAAAVAALLSLRFIKPIRTLKETVDSLAKGDLKATPGIKLKDELGQLSDSVEKLGKELQQVDILRKEVIANVSHELRSPLALIAGYAEMVRDINWKDDEKRNDDLNLIIKEAGRMSEMVKDILDYSQFQSGYIKVKKEWYNLYEIIESETSQCEPGAREHDIILRIESFSDNIPVKVDAVKICQVVRNLLNNAVNHTPDGETIKIIIKESEKGIRILVSNPGDPIPEEDRKIIWEKYQRSQHQGRRNMGTGIGLSIVSTFLNAHEMPFGVECSEGMTTFWFEYPEDQNLR